MDMDNLALEVQTQADRLFPKRTDVSMFLKMYSELGELIDSDGSHDEYADIMIMLLDYGSRKMIPIEQVIRHKMEINEQRKWTQSNLGVMRHV
jgi:hypothetical protein